MLQHSKFANTRIGLTLVELLIVLVILAALTGIAVRALDPVADQARYESTQRTLENVRNAIQDRTTTDGTIDFAGFVSDMGRLPVADANLQLSDLWNPVTPDFGIESFPDPYTDASTDVAIPIAHGWRGPYVLLASGSDALVDGYGNPFELIQNDLVSPAIAASAGDTVVNVRSLGPDATADSGDDLAFPVGTFQANRVQSSLLSATVFDSDGSPYSLNNASGERMFVRIYGPSTAGGAAVLANAELPTGQGVLNDHEGDPWVVSVGIRMVRAVVVTGVTETGSPPEPQQNSSETVVRSSAVQQVVFKPGQTVLPTLYLE